MPELDKDIAAILTDAGLGKDAVWAHKQSGKYIMYHWACEKAAARKKIEWEDPKVIYADPANKTAVILVAGKMNGAREWSFGEAAPYNTTQTYPFAMAEKRAKDRVILKLIGLHGLVYSEEEADDFKPKPNHGEMSGPLGITELKKQLRDFDNDLRACADTDQLNGLVVSSRDILDQCERDLPGWYFTKEGSDVKGLQERIAEKTAELNPLAAG